jgi:uncharacterized SAM-binding protein YcdF (DUF218 family)
MLYATIKTLVLPPTCFFVLFAMGWLLTRWRPLVGRSFLLGLLAAVYLSTTPFLAGELMAPLQPYRPVDLEKPAPDVGAIVVLSAGLHSSAPEYWQPGAPPYGVDVADSLSLQRITYAAYLARRTGKPIMLSGGSGHRAVAEAMKTTLERSFGLEPRWLEERSTTTLENAQYAADLLRKEGIRKIYLVTHAWHMPRAVMAFEKSGIAVVPAPTAFVSRSEPQWRDFVPSAQASVLTYYAIHEWLGIAWYRMATLRE